MFDRDIKTSDCILTVKDRPPYNLVVGFFLLVIRAEKGDIGMAILMVPIQCSHFTYLYFVINDALAILTDKYKAF